MDKHDKKETVQRFNVLRALLADQVERYRIPPARVQSLEPTARFVGSLWATEAWYEQPIGRQWRAAYRWTTEPHGTGVRPVIVEVRVLPVERYARPGEWSGAIIGQGAKYPRGGIPAPVMAAVRSRATLRAIKRVIAANVAQRGAKATARLMGQERVPVPALATARGRRPIYTLPFYRAFAARFSEVERRRTSGASSRAVLATEYGVALQTIANWVRKCRELALLPKTKAGQRLYRLGAPD